MLPNNLRKGSVLNLPRINSLFNGANSVHFRGTLMWNNFSTDIKSNSLNGKINVIEIVIADV